MRELASCGISLDSSNFGITICVSDQEGERLSRR